MNEQPGERGKRELEAILQDADSALERLAKASPSLAAGLTDYAFGTIYCRPELGRRERQIATVAVLAALGGAETELRIHIEGALRVGNDPTELLALGEHLSLYAGFPRALALIRAVLSCLEANGVALPSKPEICALGDHETALLDTGGDGSPIVLIHSLGLDHTLWREIMPKLAAGGRRAIAYDMRGHGRAAGAPAAPLQTYAADLGVLLDHLELPSADIAGISMGSAVACEFAVRQPSRARSLTMICAPVATSPIFEDRAAMAERDGMAEQVVPTLTRWFSPEALAANPWYVRWARERVLRAAPRDWAAAWRALSTYTAFGRASDIECPALLIAAGDDRSTPAASMEQFSNRLAQSRLMTIPNGSHLVALERPLKIAEFLLSV